MPTIKVKGMSCQHCVASVTKALSDIDGITDVQVNLEKGEATYNEQNPIAEQTIKDAISNIGFEVID
jgi:copper chaperone